MQKRAYRVGGKLGAVKSGGRKGAERCRQRFGRDFTGFRECAAAKLLGQERCAGDGGRATATEEASFGNAARFEAREELENVSANGICDFDGCGGAGEFAGVARIAEMVENGFAKHGRSIANVLRRRNAAQKAGERI